MIAIIADDLTGAAELAAAAANLGLSAEVHTTTPILSQADVIALDTDTRSLDGSQAAQVVADAARSVLSTAPHWLYKKTDSVLRGNVRAEIEAILAVLELQRALLIPANPSKGRIIQAGVYYINGVPLPQTAFSRDPEYPRTSSNVAELLGGPSAATIYIPDVERSQDVVRHAEQWHPTTLPAGGVEFFQALLRAHCKEAHHTHEVYSPTPTSGRLFVCGSPQAWGQGRRAQCDDCNVPVLTMPNELFSPSERSEDAFDAWAAQIASAVRGIGHAMTATGPMRDRVSTSPTELVRTIADVISRVLKQVEIDSVCLEGGATAAALLRAMGWTRLHALPSNLPGVAVLRPHGLAVPPLLVKPGSYPWPDQVWPQNFL